MESFTSGDAAVDELVDGLRAGDNVVWVATGGVDLGPFVKRFLRAGRPESSLVYLAMDELRDLRSRIEASTDGERHVVWCADLGSAAMPPGVGLASLACGHDWRALRSVLEGLPAFRRREARHVIAGLTAAQVRFGERGALEFFLWACPLLYRRRSVAYWLVEAERHRPEFLRRLGSITQVVLAVRPDGGGLTIEVLEADGRDAGVVGRTLRVGHDRPTTDAQTADFRDIGAAIRRERDAHGLTLAELGRASGVSGSALSQAERGVRGLSGVTLTRVWQALGVPFGPSADTEPAGFELLRRSGRKSLRTAPNVVREPLLADQAVDASIVTLAARSAGQGSPLPSKLRELVVVLGGVVEFEFGTEVVTLHEGDACVVTRQPLTGWATPGADEARLLWLLLPDS